MHNVRSLALILFAALVALTGCNRLPEDDTESVKATLAASGYTDDDADRAYGSEDTTIANGDEEPLPTILGHERPPFARFRRHVPRNGVTRTVNVTIPAYPGWDDTTALATVLLDINGTFLTCFDTNPNPLLVWKKPFHDVAVRKVFLTRDRKGWHIRRVSPMQVRTEDAAYDLRIARLTATNLANGKTWELTTADTLLAREDLPTFRPRDSVRVRIELTSTGDSCWTFLHHGKPRRPGAHWRRPYGKVSTLVFERVWRIGDEGNYERPEIRPSAHDAIGWGTLYADTTAPYVSAAWGLPYIVKNPGDPYPDEE